MKMYNRLLSIIVCVAALFPIVTLAQNGDQILDGIGETALIARYAFNGDAKDWSRNNLHGTLQGDGATFAADNRFGKVLSLPGSSNSFVTLPADALKDVESVSISGWLYLRSSVAGQRFFDFGNDTTKHFFVAPAGTKEENVLVTALDTKGIQKRSISAALEINKWTHVAVVVDVPSKSMITYIDGKMMAEVKNISPVSGKMMLSLGKSLAPNDPYLNALIHDFRIYRIPLSATQVSGIFEHAQRGINEGSVNTTSKREDDLQHFSDVDAQLYNAFLIRVSDVWVETPVGILPRLPAHLDGTYKDGKQGPKVRVLWPTPVDNTEVLKAGSYTIIGRVAGTQFKPKATVVVKEVKKSTEPELKLMPFALQQVSLNGDTHGHDSKFVENRDKFITTLAKTDPNAFLFMFRHAFGQKQPEGATPLGVWDSQDTKLRGHATGHYLTAIAQAYAGASHDQALQQNLQQKMEYMVNTLYLLSQLSGNAKEQGGTFVSDPTAVPTGAGKSEYDSDLTDAGIRTDYWNWGKGFISAYPPDQFIMLEKGARYGGQKNQIWAPYYTLHKILAGLLDVYEVSGNKKALSIATGMGNWVYARLNKVPTETLIKMWNTYIAGEFGGMNEVMARLYRITKEPNYLKTAQLFDNIRVFYGDAKHSHGLAKNVDIFRGLHANQHIPQIVGSIEMYRVSNNPEYYRIADNFWYKAVNDYMYSIGGVAGARNPANAECFIAQPASLYENGFSSDGQNETCATYNMLKLTSDLFCFDQRGQYMDYYERALYNHILASVADSTPANTYHVPLRPGSIKQFGNDDMTGFTCCNGTSIESNTKMQSAIYFRSKDNQSLYVNLFIPSTLKWTERNVTIEQITTFPKEDQTKLVVKGSGKFDVHVRVPGWATNGFNVKINNKEQMLNAIPGSYLKISRNWKDGDVIELKMPFHFYLDPIMDQPNIASLFYGPILLAAQEPDARNTWRQVTVDANDISKSIQGDPKQLQFTINGVTFLPFYETYGRHSVYLDVRLK
ncbi:beta-L-arabinofuranosidase domain-containing protein [Pseudochryseolinea flava]|uniref:Bacterial Ig-like domain-containing protein n=1 Tax=Pseudochryseolinea flava TaxID=2059302 RepID=A0A364XVH5_9BACT|nr:beta-L-arabinofuranosidase domain-containing protein [Pseudochryseolinea flava]RAV98100.1 hypothetical protein DQQ10_25545 [Pseudochryseolinea flava]